MTTIEPLIRDISDTALLAAVYRARESDRPDALFRDRFAQQLAGARGKRIAVGLPFSDRHTWSWVTRTYLFDQFITEQVAQGVDMVINLAAGLDTRPYRMELPASLTWVEVDLPAVLRYKEEALRAETAVCSLERVGLDLSDVNARRELFERLNARANKALIVTEGFLIYLTADEVSALAQDLAMSANFASWVFELASPGLLWLLQKNIGGPLSRGGAPLKFGPEEGTNFFNQQGWNAIDVRGFLKTAAGLNRVSLWMRILAMLPEPKGRLGSPPWSGVCLCVKP